VRAPATRQLRWFFWEFAKLQRLIRHVNARARLPGLPAGFQQARKALGYAQRAHGGQRRQVDGAPFILHPIEVASLLIEADEPDHVVAAGALHDTIEKTPVDAGELRRQFGIPVTRLVLAVSENDRIAGYHERKAALREQVVGAGQHALSIFAADKISKIRELRLETPSHRPTPRASASRAQRVDHYRECLSLLDRTLHESPLVAQLRSEFEALPDVADRQTLQIGASGR
jgi:(p)ppGpp synthase/HD superfamily hydrolase